LTELENPVSSILKIPDQFGDSFCYSALENVGFDLYAYFVNATGGREASKSGAHFLGAVLICDE
jgi:hypothetical protein